MIRTSHNQIISLGTKPLRLSSCYLNSELNLNIIELDHCTVSHYTFTVSPSLEVNRTSFQSVYFSSNSEDDCKINQCIIEGNISLYDGAVVNLAAKASKIGGLYLNNTSSLILNDCEIGKLVTAVDNTHSVKCDNVLIENASFKGRFVQDFHLERVRFKNTPVIENMNFLSRNINFSEVYFSNVSDGNALGVFRSFKKCCEEAGYEHGAIMFHGYELETYYGAGVDWFS